MDSMTAVTVAAIAIAGDAIGIGLIAAIRPVGKNSPAAPNNRH